MKGEGGRGETWLGIIRSPHSENVCLVNLLHHQYPSSFLVDLSCSAVFLFFFISIVFCSSLSLKAILRVAKSDQNPFLLKPLNLILRGIDCGKYCMIFSCFSLIEFTLS